MSSVNRLLSLIIVFAIALFAACGGGGSHITPTPPPSGGFGLSSLKGTYVFSTGGSDLNGNFLTIAGTFAADGNGNITAGTMDMDDSGFTTAFVTGIAITGGKYSVTADGRGQASLSANTPFGRSIGVDFVLTSSSHGLISEFDGNGSGSGTLDLQSSATLSGSYAFSLSGVGSSGSIATVGSFTLDSSGNITAGVQDFNAAGAFTNFPLSGTVTAGSPGSATLTTSGALGSLGFDVFAVDSTHVKLIGISGSALLSGDGFTQQGAALPAATTTFALVLSGGTSTPLAVGGLLSVDGKGNITGGSVDINNNATLTSSSITGGSYAAAGSVGGRTIFTPSGFGVATSFVAYPTASAGLQILESDNTGLLAGVAFAQQSGAALSSSQGYAMGLSAANLSAGAEEDDIAEFTTSSGSFSGIIDINDQGSIANSNQGQRYTGTYTLDSPATGRGEINQSNYNLGIFYAVDSSTLLFLDAGDNIGLVGTGIFELQNSKANPALAAEHALVAPRVVRGGPRRQNR